MVIATKRDLPDLLSEIINNLVQTLASLSADANEAIVDLNCNVALQQVKK